MHRDGAIDPRLRLADMDVEGIDVAVLYGTASLGFWGITDRDLGRACCRAYNDWLAEYCAADPTRLKGTPALPLSSLDDTLDEARRTVTELGFVSITVPCCIGPQNLDDPELDPLRHVRGHRSRSTASPRPPRGRGGTRAAAAGTARA